MLSESFTMLATIGGNTFFKKKINFSWQNNNNENRVYCVDALQWIGDCIRNLPNKYSHYLNNNETSRKKNKTQIDIRYDTSWGDAKGVEASDADDDEPARLTFCIFHIREFELIVVLFRFHFCCCCLLLANKRLTLFECATTHRQLAN